MFGSLRRWFRISSPPSELEKFEPIYGLPHRALDEWLSQNSQLRKDYDIELAARALRGPRPPIAQKQTDHFESQ
jgi:hypothetical protein